MPKPLPPLICVVDPLGAARLGKPRRATSDADAPADRDSGWTWPESPQDCLTRHALPEGHPLLASAPAGWLPVATGADPADQVGILRRLHPDRDLILIAVGCQLPDAWLTRLRGLHTGSDFDVVSPLDRGHPALAPGLADCLTDDDALCWRYGASAVVAHEFCSPGLSLWPAEAAAAADGTDRPLRIGILPRICVQSAASGPATADRQAPTARAITALRRAAAGLSRPLSPGLPGCDGLAVVLHVVHGWGGGSERFVRDLMAADRLRRHLVLVSVSDPDRRLHGTALALHDHLDGPALARWPLARAIETCTEHDPTYRQILAEILARYGIGAILVSSVIGHSLDVLDTGLPTAVCCHDPFPLWPWLDASFRTDQRFDDAALRERLASDPPPAFRPWPTERWQGLANAWRTRLIETGASLVTPSDSARSNLLRLAPDLADQPWQVIGHGLDGFVPVTRRARPGAPLRVLVPGRITDAKGARLLAGLVDRLPDDIELILLGCGAAGMAFFGTRNVHAVLDYRREQLPTWIERLAPDLALFPRTVAETWSYALSEMWALDVPVLATRLGSLTERIEDGQTGLLVEPDADAILAALIAIAADRGRLAGVRPGPTRSLACMAECWREALPATPTVPGPWPSASPELIRTLDLDCALAEAQYTQARLTVRITEQTRELDARAEWAGDLERRLAASEHARHTALTELEARLGATETELAEERDRRRTVEQQHTELHATYTRLDRVHEDVQQQARQQQARITELEAALDTAYGYYDRDTADLAHQRDIALAQRDQVQAQMATLLDSRSWRLTRPLRALTRTLGYWRSNGRFRFRQARSLIRRLLLSLSSRGWLGTLRRIRMEFDNSRSVLASDSLTQPESQPIRLTCPALPRVSVIIPAYNQIDYTLTCLRSLAGSGDRIEFETIVVDDHSNDDTPERLAGIDGLRWHRNERNLGFIGACNAGALLARGEFIVFLNNDTKVKPGWLDALIGTFDSHPRTGLVGAKLIYPDGRLQEAGGLVFSDASGWNVGRFDDPADPRYNTVREVDYCSGAAIALRRELFTELGGFDPRYAPAYYEDTDLAMKVRAHGLKVLYQPRSEVIHFEGISHGTDLGSGIKAHQVANQARFLERWRDVLERDHPRQGTPIEVAIGHRSRMRVLVIDACTPTPDRDSGSLRMFNLLKLLREEGCSVAFFADNRAHDGHYTHALQQLGVEAWWHPYIGNPVAWLDRHGSRLDLVVVSRHYVASAYLPLLRQYAPQARVAFDTVDLHYLREQREAELNADVRLARRAAHTRELELAVIADSDLTLVVSPFEQKLLAREAPEAKVCVLSNVHEIAPERAGYSERAGLVFVGGYRHPPNVDAARWFADAVFPLIRERAPEIELHLIGADMPDSILALAQRPGIHCHGHVPDIAPWMNRCRVALAPLRYGAGVKGKINLSMAHGQPVVATRCAVEGMYLREDEDVLVADQPSAFADAVLRLYHDPALWRRLADNGVDNVRQHFSFEAARQVVRQHLIGNDRPSRRPLLHSVPRSG